MRLTLRTLLAYLDEILDPQDAEPLRRKIEESEFASSLVHQIRGSVRRLRLDAPALDAQGIGGDLNSVAEYLDNTLPPDQVPALEKVCLDNEVHLGEVASCHQILTLVLGQAADVSDRMRQRTYGLAPTAGASTDLPPVEDMSPPTAVSSHAAAVDVGGGASSVPATDPAPSDVHAEQAAGVQRRFDIPTDMPSTKEAWRAEAKEQSLSETQAHAQAVPAGAPIPESDPGQEVASHPVPPLSPTSPSLLKSAAVGAIVVLLILCGLFFAAWPFEGNHFLAGWLGQNRPVAHDGVETIQPSAELPPSPTSVSEQPVEIDVVDSSLPPTEWQPADSQFDRPVLSSSTTRPDPNAGELPLDDSLENPTDPDDGHGFVNPDLNKAPDREADLPRLVDDPQLVLEPPIPADYPRKSASADSPHAPLAAAPEGRSTNDEALRGETSSGLPKTADDSPEEIANLPPTETPSLTEIPDGFGSTRDDELLTSPTVPPPSTSSTPEFSSASIEQEQGLPKPAVRRAFEPIKLKTSDQLLLVFDAQEQDWQQVDATQPLAQGSLLMGLPAFRADVEMGDAPMCSLVGSTRLQLGPDAEVTLFDGHLLLRAVKDRQRQGVRFRDELWTISIEQEEGVVALEVSHVHIPGSEVAAIPHTILKAYAVKHDATIDYRGASHELRQGQVLIGMDDFEPRIETAAKKPKWTSATSISRADASSVRFWKRDLGNVQNMRIWLQERANNRRYNERALAARCLAEMDEFDAIVAALNDRQQHPFWDQQYETLRRALTRGQDTADKLRFELEKVHGPGASLLMEMIRGYSGKQLAEGAAAELVKNLEHQALDHRVLAFQNLKRITGFTQAFHPEKPVAYRNRSVKQWQGKLRAGRITYAKAPEVVTLLESFARQ